MIRTLWYSLEAVHAMIYFAPQADSRYAAAGLDRPGGYFASRAAALGEAGPEVVIATFYNFNPDLVRACVPRVWETVTPRQMLELRLAAADEALKPILPGDLEEITGLARRAAERSTEMLHGRTLFAAHASLPWPDETHLRLWHAQTLLREFRGDGHLAALLKHNLTGIEALVLHAAEGAVPAETLRKTRAWSEEKWAETAEDLRSRGLIGENHLLTDAGRALRQSIEDETDAMNAAAYDVLSEQEKQRYVELAAPLSKAVVAAGLIPGRR
ncbi:SCO6745 family protein [Lentzea sp. E54]|uniref:SCO6745 family protein n=1 Tax=Lentzea xerophila TaxID=3435883 RepID=UPI003DA26F9D